MICGEFHNGSGLGDQLHRYITIRTLAESRGFKWGFYNPEMFKGDFFLNFDKGVDPALNASTSHDLTVFNEKDVRDENGVDIRSYDPGINFIDDHTFVDGSFEDDKYWRRNLDNINKWLAVEPLEILNNQILIGFRGGEYATQPDLFLPKSYYEEAQNLMLNLVPGGWFEIHTDDVQMAKDYLPWDGQTPRRFVENERISHSKHSNMGLNWRSMRYAKHAIIPNSAFYILPRILKHHEDPTAVTIAPHYWARHNTKIWARPACYYPEFQYI